MGIKEKIFISKNESKNSNYVDTNKWKIANKVILFETQNGGESTIDEIPGGGMVQQRIAAQEKQIQKHKAELNSSSTSCFNDTVSSPSETSISSQYSSYEQNNNVQQEKQKKASQIPTRSNSSLFSNNSRSEPSKIFKLDTNGRLAILSKNHPFLIKITPERAKIPQSHRNAIRIDNLTDKELKILSNNYVDKVITADKSNFKL